jgi:hypothetical protein
VALLCRRHLLAAPAAVEVLGLSVLPVVVVVVVAAAAAAVAVRASVERVLVLVASALLPLCPATGRNQSRATGLLSCCRACRR